MSCSLAYRNILKKKINISKKNDPIYELETDKITSEVTAEITGIIKIKADVDEEVDIGSIVAVIEGKEIVESANKAEKPNNEIQKPIEPEVTKIEKVIVVLKLAK